MTELAAGMQCAVSTVKRWEAQGLAAPSEALVANLANVLGTSHDRVRRALRS